jgi:Zn-dependent M28 family amino/carboxypeptidase
MLPGMTEMATDPGGSPASGIRRRRLLVAGALLVIVAAVAVGTQLLRPAPTENLPTRLRDAVSVEAVMADLAALEGIADANGGMRASGTAGYDASVGYVSDQLRAAGYDVHLDTLQIATFLETGPGSATIEPGAGGTAPAGRTTFTMGEDFRPMIFSAAAADLVAPIRPVEYDPRPGADTSAAKGCRDGDFDGVTAGSIILVLPGPCTRREVVDRAVAVGAAGLVVAYPSWDAGAVRRPTLITPGVTIPVLATTREVGSALLAAAQAGLSLRLTVPVETAQRPTANVVAETARGDPGHVVVLGGHLDSVMDGPGINDNGSGAMAVLEVARQLADLDPRWKVRFGFWAGEETGLFGSFHYLQGVSQGDRDAIAAYLNLDMLGSPHGVRLVYASPSAPAGSDRITGLFGAALDAATLAWEPIDLPSGSDHFAFNQFGIATGGLYSGSLETPTADQAQRFGLDQATPFDACYHVACDRVANVDPDLLGQMLRALAEVTGTIAAGESGL